VDVSSLYETFEPTEAWRLAQKLEIHYTPKHGSWLNMAEIELSVLSRQCLDRRVPDFETLQSEARAWQEQGEEVSRVIAIVACPRSEIQQLGSGRHGNGVW
jgi:hypothetical protein